jgi:hypothetical protein
MPMWFRNLSASAPWDMSTKKGLRLTCLPLWTPSLRAGGSSVLDSRLAIPLQLQTPLTPIQTGILCAPHQRQAVALPTTTPVQLNPGVPEGLARIIDRSLAKDRELRYQHAWGIRTDFEAVQRNPAAEIAPHFLSSGMDSSTHPSSGLQTFENAVHGGARFASTTSLSS